MYFLLLCLDFSSAIIILAESKYMHMVYTQERVVTFQVVVFYKQKKTSVYEYSVDTNSKWTAKLYS